jgi:hypothetical protein
MIDNTRTFIVNIDPKVISKVFSIFYVHYNNKLDIELLPPKKKDKCLTILSNNIEDVAKASNILKGIELGVIFGQNNECC